MRFPNIQEKLHPVMLFIFTSNPKRIKIIVFSFLSEKNKDDNEAKEFYFLGEIFTEGNPRQIYMEKTKDNAFEIDYRLDVPVRSDIYDYIVSD